MPARGNCSLDTQWRNGHLKKRRPGPADGLSRCHQIINLSPIPTNPYSDPFKNQWQHLWGELCVFGVLPLSLSRQKGLLYSFVFLFWNLKGSKTHPIMSSRQSCSHSPNLLTYLISFVPTAKPCSLWNPTSF